MKRYQIIATGQTIGHNELQAHFPNVSFAPTLDADVLTHFGLSELPPDTAAELSAAQAAMNLTINQWRATANKTSFTFAGKQIACDDLSRSDIDAVANVIALTGSFPAGFPNAWKAMDNTYVALASVADFKAMYGAMAQQGTTNFGHSQQLKAAVAAATTVDQVNSIQW